MDGCKKVLEEAVRLARDNIHGSTWITNALCDLALAAKGYDCLNQVANTVMAGHMGMIQVENLCRILLDTPENIQNSIDKFRNIQLQGKTSAIRDFRSAVFSMFSGKDLRMMTISDSSAVRDAIIAVSGQVKEVVIGESRPAFEGRRLAGFLADRGIPCTVTVDVALFSLVKEMDFVVLGCDAVFADHFVNKIGSAMLTSAAQALNKRVFVLADRTKFSDKPLNYKPKFGKPTEIWPQAKPGINLINPYLETVEIMPVVRILGLDVT